MIPPIFSALLQKHDKVFVMVFGFVIYIKIEHSSLK